MVAAFVLYVAIALVPGRGPVPVLFESKEVCESQVVDAREHGMLVTDCAKVELSAPKPAV